MKTCATCRFMAAPRDDDPYPLEGWSAELDDTERSSHATCVRIVHGNGYREDTPPWPEVKRAPAVVIDGSGYAARLLVLPTFGCTLHEERDGEVKNDRADKGPGNPG